MKNPFLDQNFLRKLDLVENKVTYAKIILLTWDEQPVEEIQGKITTGSINIDGASAVRRTCSLTMVSNKVDINNTYWALKNKFKLEIGIENNIDSNYPDIIWFKQGIYIFTSLNMNVSSNNFTIALNGKDKMCLLNGEVGGTINAFTDFGKYEEYETLDNGEIIRNISNISIVDIIKNVIHTYAREPLHNIVLNDIENFGLELLEYRGNNNLYMPRNISNGEVSNLIINPKQEYYLIDGSEVYVDNEKNKNSGRKEIIYYDRTGINHQIATKVWATPGSHMSNEDKLKAFNIIKIEYGETAGYRQTALTYPGELVANVGENIVTGVLDKIKNMFGDFEYFYDIDGRFIFQKKKTYINTSFNNLTSDGVGIYAENSAYTSSTTYSFEDGVLLTAFTNAPQILNIRNDFSIWGKRTSLSGAEIPVHMRYAIDKKPIYYKPVRFIYREKQLNQDTYIPKKYYTYSQVLDKYVLETATVFDNNKTYFAETDIQDFNTTPFTINEYDWREIIYQMALDYFQYNHRKSNFTQLVAAANSQYYPTGITGYEPYYTDLQGFWRQLYHPGVLSENGNDEYYKLFTKSELYEAAKEIILEERKFINDKDIAQMMIDYAYDNYEAIRNNLISEVEIDDNWEISDYSLKIQEFIDYGFTENSKVIQTLLKFRWNKMNNKDNYDYASLISQAQSDGKYSLAKTYQILNNYKIQQEFLNKYDDIDISRMIEDKLANGYSEDAAEVQSLLATRWQKIILKSGQDNYDYLSMMEKEYKKNGESSLYKTYVLMYEYSNSHQQESLVIQDKQFFETDLLNNNNIKIIDPYLSFLYLSRQKKLNTLNSDDFIVSNERFIWVIITTLGQIDISKNAFKLEIKQRLKEQSLEENATDFAQKAIDHITNNYDVKGALLKIELDEEQNIVKDVIILDSYLLYLFNMRQEKIDSLGNTKHVLENEKMLNIIANIFLDDKITNGTQFKTECMTQISNAVDDTDIDHTQLIINYIRDNYNNTDVVKFEENGKIEKPLRFSVSKNCIEVNDTTLADYLTKRFEKISNLTNFDIYINNDELEKHLITALETTDTAVDFEIKFKSLLSYSVKTQKTFSTVSSTAVQTNGLAYSEIPEEQLTEKIKNNKQDIIDYFKNSYDDNGWNKIIQDAPEMINFWFDFMSIQGDIGKYAVSAIGSRPKAVNNDKISAIYFKEVPPVLFLTNDEYEQLMASKEDFSDMTGYTFIKLQPFMENYFTISGQGKSAKDELDNLLYQHTYATENVTLTAVPIYYLQPNTRIFVKDEYTGINGEYIMSKVTVPLQYNGTTSITATKAVERLY